MSQIDADKNSLYYLRSSASSAVDSHPLHVVLVEPEIAGNVGAIGRTCVAIGARLWLVRPLGFLLDDRRVKRAGLDYWEHLDFTIVDAIAEVVDVLGADRLWSFSTKASRVYTDAPYRPGDALVFGRESRGLAESWLSGQGDRALRIPIRPEARSLNLGTAVAVAAFEAARQCRLDPSPEPDIGDPTIHPCKNAPEGLDPAAAKPT